jgi:hypothetical protein
MSFVRARFMRHCRFALNTQLFGHRSRKRYGITNARKIVGNQRSGDGNARGGAVIPAKLPCLCAKFSGPAVHAIGFRKADGISGPAQKNNPKAVVLIERARRIKFDDSDRHRLRNAAGFCKQPAKRGSPY